MIVYVIQEQNKEKVVFKQKDKQKAPAGFTAHGGKNSAKKSNKIYGSGRDGRDTAQDLKTRDDLGQTVEGAAATDLRVKMLNASDSRERRSMMANHH